MLFDRRGARPTGLENLLPCPPLPPVSAALNASERIYVYNARTRFFANGSDRDHVNLRGQARGMRAVAQVALDDTWSALRFRLA